MKNYKAVMIGSGSIGLTAVILTVYMLLGCSGGEKVSFDTLETNRAIANDNAKFNAQKWRADNGYGDHGMLVRGDSTQQASCPQGDGWASLDLIDANTKQVKQKLKCSTVSVNIGCMKAEDFKSRAVYASQEGKCNADLQIPLKKIEN